jgi:hypothetical protein
MDDQRVLRYFCHEHEHSVLARLLPVAAAYDGTEGLEFVRVTLDENGIFAPPTKTPKAVDFVWENTPVSICSDVAHQAQVYNHLNGAHIFEDKFSMALMQSRIPKDGAPASDDAEKGDPSGGSSSSNGDGKGRTGFLDSEVFKTFHDFKVWCATSKDTWDSLWMVKDPLGNSGIGVWLMGPNNVDDILQKIQEAGTKKITAQRSVRC